VSRYENVVVCGTVVKDYLGLILNSLCWATVAHQNAGRIWQLAYNTNHKQGTTKLLKLFFKYLLMVTI